MSNKVIVPPAGLPEAKIAFVGEAPGAREVALRQPFVGPSGELLDRFLLDAQLTRADCYILNVIGERPPGNQISHFINLAGKGLFGVDATDAYHEYERELHERLAHSSANVVVALGGTALYALTRKKGIYKWRGSILESIPLGQAGVRKKVIPTLHPAATLRGIFLDQYLIAHDIKRAAGEMDDPALNLPERHLLVGSTFEECRMYLHMCGDREEPFELVAFDIEVLNDEVSCISLSPSPKTAISIPFLKEGREYFNACQEEQIWERIADLLEDPAVRKVAHNAAFDMTFLFQKYGIRARNVECSMIAQGILAPDFRKGLDFITSIHTREPYYKDDGKQYLKSPNSDRLFWEYNAKDSAVCREAFPILMRELEKAGNVETYRRQQALLEPLVWMQARGMRFDHGGMFETGLRLDREAYGLERELERLVGHPLNANSSKQCAEYFYEEKGLKAYHKRGGRGKSGAVTTDETAMLRIARKGFKEARLILDIRERHKMKDTYVDMLYDEDKRLRGSFNPVGTKTGRLSSSATIAGTGGNCENLPPEMKRHIIADEGRFLCEVDLSQAENRIVAYIAPEPTMRAAFESGKDVHRLTAALIFGIPYEEVTEEQRQKAKRANHSLNYGLSAEGFSLKNDFPLWEAKEIHTAYHRTYPGVCAYHDWVQDQLRQDRTITNLYGRKREFLDRWGSDLWREAYAHIPQSSVADKINDCLAWIHREEGLQEVEILNQVHDSLWLQLPLDRWGEVAEWLMRIVERLERPLYWLAQDCEFVIPAEVKIGRNMGSLIGVPAESMYGSTLRQVYEGSEEIDEPIRT